MAAVAAGPERLCGRFLWDGGGDLLGLIGADVGAMGGWREGRDGSPERESSGRCEETAARDHGAPAQGRSRSRTQMFLNFTGQL